MTTYDRGDGVVNDSELYDELFDKRGVDKIIQYKTKILSTSFKDKDIAHIEHHWSHGDRYHKLASQYYNDFRLWWVIAIFNEKPSEASLKYGDKIKIPINFLEIVNVI
jgi:hypothetical protein